jgi:hypothetical protein
MTFVSQDVSVCDRAGHSAATGSWSGTKKPRWGHTLSHLGAAMCITAGRGRWMPRTYPMCGDQLPRWSVRLMATSPKYGMAGLHSRKLGSSRFNSSRRAGYARGTFHSLLHGCIRA